MSCSGHQRAVDGDNVRLCIQLIQRYVFQIQIRVGECIVSNNLHAEALQNVNHAKADFACADNACCLANQGNAFQTSDVEVEFCCSFIGKMRLPVYCHQQSRTLFCNGFRGVCRYSQNGQTAFLRNFQINAVKACAAQKKNFDAQVLQFADNLSGNFIIYERACCVMTSCQMCSSGCQPFVKECNFIAIFFCHGLKAVFPVRFGVKECNFHRYLLLKNIIDKWDSKI